MSGVLGPRGCLVLAGSLMLLSCRGDSGSSPQESLSDLCADVAACDPDTTVEECQTIMARVQGFMIESAWEGLLDCFSDASCEEINSDAFEGCMEEVVATAPAGGAEQIITAVCARTLECGETTLSEEQCEAEADRSLGSDGEGGGTRYFGLINEETQTCLTRCIEEAPCEALGEEGMPESCPVECGMNFE